MIARREFLTLLGGTAAWPVTARAQQPAMPVVGFLNGGSPSRLARELDAFHQGLAEAGYVEGRNLAIEYHWEGHNEQFPAMAADLVQHQVALIAAFNAPAALAAKVATTTIPIVFLVAVDPVANGLAASLNRPGGNLTGVATLNVGVAAKRLELLHEIAPGAAAFAVLVNPTNPPTRKRPCMICDPPLVRSGSICTCFMPAATTISKRALPLWPTCGWAAS